MSGNLWTVNENNRATFGCARRRRSSPSEPKLKSPPAPPTQEWDLDSLIRIISTQTDFRVASLSSSQLRSCTAAADPGTYSADLTLCLPGGLPLKSEDIGAAPSSLNVPVRVCFCCLYDADTSALSEKVIPWAYIPVFAIHLRLVFHLLRPRNR